MSRFWFVPLVLAGLGCAGSPGNGTAASETLVRSAELGADFELRPGELATIEGTGVRVRFTGVRHDSRCPVDVHCVWAGDGELELRLWDADVDSADVVVHTGGEPRTARVGDFELRLESLRPEPVSTIQIPPSEYIARFVVRPRP